MAQPEAPAAIYDLGYQRYAGDRGGRVAIVIELFVYSLRSVFGLGRRTSSKVIPVGLAVLAFLPAAVQLGIAAVASNIIEVFRPENYYGYIQWILALFVAAVAPELIGRDRRHRTLTLYFSRSLSRADYVAAKFAALAAALLGLTLLPQTVLFVGNALAGNDVPGYLRDNWKDIPPIIATAVVLSVSLSSFSLLLASLTQRRMFASGGIVAYFAIASALGSAAVEFSSGAVQRWGLTMSAFHVTRGFTFWVFRTDPEPNSALDKAGLAMGWYGLVLFAAVAVCTPLLLRRYSKVPA